jgi:hypothetical protein
VLLLCGTSISAAAAEDFSQHHIRQQTSNGGGVVMKGFVKDIEGLAVKNDEFRRVL